MKQECYDIVIVGAGPAGMTAALYALRAEKSVLLLEAEAYGGQILKSNRVENYPGAPEIGGFDLAEQMMSQLRALNVELVSASVSKVAPTEDGYCITTTAGNCAARAVILATGVSYRRLNVPGEDRLIGAGVSFCATCDGRFFKGREVAVVGGGNTAVQDALELAHLCSKVYLIHRRDGFRAEARLLERLRNTPNVEILTDTVVAEMRGEWALSSLLLHNVKTGDTRELAVAGVFEAVGVLPRNEAFRALIELDAEGYILADETCQTSAKGIFAAGDCRSKAVRQLTTAVADGTVAALAATAYTESAQS